ncbi:DNA polymerase III subunit gamma/tau [bacterium]|nr:DNA polymerase III subunit gamma/tau [bacterium]
MSYLVTARKWRPQIFDDVVAQESITTTLKKALETNRIAQAYLFSGPRGVGKTTAARILAKAVNCENRNDGNPCNKCVSCENSFSGRGMDIFEIDGASNNSVDDVRELRESVKFPPLTSKYKVYIIDEIHMLSKPAFNALLKTLEEPPSHLIFIFATTEPHKLLPTVLSRCQRYDFKSIPIEEIIERLRFISTEEGIKIDEGSLHLIAKTANGGMRDAQTTFDQVVAFCGNNVKLEEAQLAIGAFSEDTFFEITYAIKSKEIGVVFKTLEKISNGGFDLVEFAKGLTEHFRNLLVCSSLGNANLVPLSEFYRKKYLEEAQAFTTKDLVRLFDKTTLLESGVRHAEQQRFFVENSLVQMVKMDKGIEIEALISRIQDLKKNFENLPKSSISSFAPNENLLVKTENHEPAGEKETSKPEEIVFEDENLLEQLKKKVSEEIQILAQEFQKSELESFKEQIFTLRIFLRSDFIKKQFETNKKNIEDFLCELSGKNLRLKLTYVEEAVTEPQKTSENDTKKLTDPIIEEALNLFGGKLEKL